jgi:hypothetical protein
MSTKAYEAANLAEAGKATQFKPGWKGGPGRPKNLTKRLLALLESKVSDDPEAKTHAEELIRAGYERAKKSSDTLFIELYNRVEGKVGSDEEGGTGNAIINLTVNIPRAHNSHRDVHAIPEAGGVPCEPGEI